MADIQLVETSLRDGNQCLWAALGIDTQKDNSKFGFMVNLHRIIFTEDNVNFYMGSAAGLISIENPSTLKTDSGFELSAFIGAEFFFTGKGLIFKLICYGKRKKAQGHT